jgi:hypothetical protein
MLYAGAYGHTVNYPAIQKSDSLQMFHVHDAASLVNIIESISEHMYVLPYYNDTNVMNHTKWP